MKYLKYSILLFAIAAIFTPLRVVAMERTSSDSSDCTHLHATFTIAAFVGAHLLNNLLGAVQNQAPTYAAREPQNRGVFLVTNEINNEDTIRDIRHLPARGNVGIGVSALFNLELFVVRFDQGVTHWVMIDPAMEVQHFWRVLQAIFSQAPNLDIAFEALLEVMTHNSGAFFTQPFMALNFNEEQERYRHWLRRCLEVAQSRLQQAMGNMPFSTLSQLVQDRILFCPTDLANQESVDRLMNFLSSHKFQVDTLYASNVYMWLPQSDVATYESLLTTIRTHTQSPFLAYLVEAGPPQEGEYFRIWGKPIQRIHQ